MKLRKYQSQKNDDLNRKLKSYSALTGAFLVGAGAANAQIVYTDINPDTLIVGGSYDIDLDADGTPDFHFLQASSSGTAAVLIGADSLHLNNRVMATTGTAGYIYPSKLALGNPIGPAGPLINFANHSYMSLAFVYSTGNVLGHFNGQAGYVGVEFKTGANTYYGWIDCEVTNGGDSLIIKSYAYQSTPLTLINAGAGSTSGIESQQSAINKPGNFYPNPVKSGKAYMRIDAKDFADLNVEILNGMGQVMQNENRRLISGKNIIDINVDALANGTYFVKLTQGDHTYFRKVLVNN